jgi:hypothetical protein
MARKIDDHLNYFGNESETEAFTAMSQPWEQEPLFGEWLRRDPRWTTDRLIDMVDLREQD